MYLEHGTIAAETDGAAALIRSCEGECGADAVDEIREAVDEADHVDIGGPG